MNQEVVEATCQCMLAQADKAEGALVSAAQLEQTVISEFSRCLMQIIGSYTSRSRGQYRAVLESILKAGNESDVAEGLTYTYFRYFRKFCPLTAGLKSASACPRRSHCLFPFLFLEYFRQGVVVAAGVSWYWWMVW
ncbi:hypothetical protein O3P69_015551 [Scylla paramamosain]|uniref:Uncharacterized protein n=1 Tax=Scylla paramamosain TaxID=85552 RepID=A0AAW0SDV0_SCYPA